ncbi:MAG: hypothetical protein K0R38_173 [Polyangiaceae bacterium]|jgi:hypothetical protein|nr:hypothetical protein [Polyangiaceae bacterium]
MVKKSVMLSGRRLSRRSTPIAAALAIFVALGSPQAHAQSTSDDLARRHFESGVAYLEESDYDSAITAFQKAYDLSRRPEILLNLATVHERKSDLVSAIAALRAYSDAEPEGEHVTTVRLRIQNLEKRLQERSPAPAEATPVPPPAAPASVEPAVSAAPPPPALRPQPNRMPAFISLGVGGLMGAGALATGIIAKAKYDDAEETCGPTCRDDQLSSSRTFALTSTVLTGAAVLGVGLGVVLLLTTPDEESESEVASLVPRWDVAVTSRAASGRAEWRF